jgi:hypothetical protein
MELDFPCVIKVVTELIKVLNPVTNRIDVIFCVVVIDLVSNEGIVLTPGFKTMDKNLLHVMCG